MAKTKSCYKFYFNKLHKSLRIGNAPTAITYQEYTQDESLCVVRTLENILAEEEKSIIHPHKPVVSSTISVLLKTILMKSGIDTSTFKAHSTRSASASKAGLQGASIEDILKRGSWSNKSNWQRCFNKNIVEEGQTFQEMVFKSPWDLQNALNRGKRIGFQVRMSKASLENAVLDWRRVYEIKFSSSFCQ